MEIVTTHKGADFDALACMVAGTLLYPSALACLPETINPNVRSFLSLHKDHFSFIRPKDVDFDEVSRLIVVDTNSWHRLDGFSRLKDDKHIAIHLYDHHKSNGDIEPTWRCQQPVGAAITLMFDELMTRDRPISPLHANLFLAGLYEDTGNLTFPSTTARDVRTAAELLEAGADLNILNAFVKPAFSVKQKDLLFDMLKKAKRVKLNGLHVTIIPMEVDGYIDSLAVVVQSIRQILNVEAAFGIFSLSGNRSLIVGRSVSDAINIGTIMRCMGGGGHPGAGSVLVKAMNPGVLAAWIRILTSGESHATGRIQDIMTTDVFTLTPGTTMMSAFQSLRDHRIHGAPIMDNGKLTGMISMRDMRRLKRSAQMHLPVKAFMTSPVRTISAWKNPAEAAHRMARHDIGRLPVFDDGQLVGIITRSDAMAHFYGLCPLDGHLNLDGTEVTN